jgi:hypothetical protein
MLSFLDKGRNDVRRYRIATTGKEALCPSTIVAKEMATDKRRNRHSRLRAIFVVETAIGKAAVVEVSSLGLVSLQPGSSPNDTEHPIPKYLRRYSAV